MADALRKAGFGNSPEARKPSKHDAKSKSSKHRSRKGRSRELTEKEMLKKELEGVQPLKSKGDRVSLRSARKKNGSVAHQGIPKRKLRPIPPVKMIVSSDGKKRVIMDDPSLLIYQSNKRNQHSVQSMEKQRLVVADKVSINPQILAGDTEHLYSNELLLGSVFDAEVESNGEVELVIGLDFGTSYCKVVVQEPDAGLVWAVPLSDSVANPFLLSTQVWKDSEVFNLVGKGDRIGNLKVPLLDKDMPPNHVFSVIAYLVLVLRHAKTWILENKMDEIAGMVPVWVVNMGLPARSLEDKGMVATFRKVLWAAMLLAEGQHEHVSVADARKAFLTSHQAVKEEKVKIIDKDGNAVYSDQLSLMPEIAAQIYGYLMSDAWDPGHATMLLADVGGGTVDGSIFHVEKHGSEETRFSFISSSVENLGVYVLHRERLNWHVEQMEGDNRNESIESQLKGLLEENVMPEKIPGHIEEYLQGAVYPDKTKDHEFYNRFARMLWDDVIMEYRAQGMVVVKGESVLPYMLCGGGRNIGLYDQFIQKVNGKNSSTSLRLKQLDMPVPEQLAKTGITQDIYQRLSVAYGLSFLDIGEVITPDMFPPQQSSRQQTTYKDNFVSKDQV